MPVFVVDKVHNLVLKQQESFIKVVQGAMLHKKEKKQLLSALFEAIAISSLKNAIKQNLISCALYPSKMCNNDGK